jgi:hypothetical protein
MGEAAQRYSGRLRADRITRAKQPSSKWLADKWRLVAALERNRRITLDGTVYASTSASSDKES